MDATTGAAAEWRIGPDEWDEALAEVDGPQIVVGGPGTGKTEFLVRRATQLLARPDVATSSLLVLSFGRRGVADLRQRISRAVGSVGDLDISTFHSYAIRMVEKHGAGDGWHHTAEVLTGPEQQAVVAQLLASADPAQWSPAYRGILTSHTFAEELTDFVLRAAEQLLSAADIADMDRADWRGIPQFLERYEAELRRRQRLDYGTLLREAVRIVGEEALPPEATPRFILVDEYQDTTLAQAQLLSALCSDGGNLTVAADPYQSVYSFRGARLENVAEFPERFRQADGSPGRRIVLTTSFRTPRAILEAAVNVTSRRLPGAAGRVTPAPGGGRVDVHIFGQQTEEAEWVASEVERVHLSQGIPLNRLGVLVRSKRRFLPDLSRSLERRGIAHDLPDSRLADHPAVRFVLDLIAAAAGDERPADTIRALRRILLGPMYQLPLGELRTIERNAVARGDWSAALRAAGLDKLAALIANPDWAQHQPAADGVWHVWENMDAARDIVSDPERRDERLAWRSLAQVIGRWNARNPEATLVDYRRLTESEDFEAQPLLSFRQPQSDRLTVTTLHQAKGLEFDTVFISDAVEGVFPDLRPRDSLLGVRHLMGHLPTDPAAYTSFRLQEERRLAYTAMTRARSRVVWTATAVGAEAGQGVPSRFLPLVAGVGSIQDIAADAPTAGPPVSPREAEAHLRRAAADPATAAPYRRAAIAALAQGTKWRMRPPLHHSGVAARGPATGLNGDQLRLSPSEADDYARCPRRYAIERRLHQAADSVYARFGSLVHEVLDQVESEAMQRAEIHGDYVAAARRLEQLMDAAEFGGGHYAAAWRRRALVGLARLYSNWPSGGRPIGIERRVEFKLGNTSWRGRIDRVEEDESGLKVVDYKTSKQPISRTEASESLQLGFYALALAADPEMLAHGEPTAAEFWYPLGTGKTVPTRSLNMNKLEEIGHRLISLADDIAAERWEPRTGEWCERCAFASSCPARAEGGSRFA